MAEKTIEELEAQNEKRFKGIEEGLLKIVELVGKSQQTPAQVEVQKVADAETKSVEPNNLYVEPVHPDWVADAKEKLGEKLDHCEVDYPKNGIPRYTVVIKLEHSNASQSHKDFYKIDRRTIPVTNGFESVKAWNSLVAQNLRLSLQK